MEGVFIDPRTKLFVLAVLSTMMINADSEGIYLYLKSIMAALPCLLLLSCGRSRAALLYILVFALSWAAVEYLLPYTSGLGAILTGFIASMGSRWLPGAMMGYYFLASTQANEFVAGMERMRVSQKIVIPCSVMFRFFPTVLEESRAIHDAMRIRGIGGIRRLVTNPLAMLEYRLVPLMTSVVTIGNDLSAAAMTRGLGCGKKRTSIARTGFGAVDALLFMIGGLMLAAFILERGGRL